MTSPLRPSPRFGHPSYLGLDSDDAAGTTSFLADLGGRGTSGGGLFFGTPARFAGQQHLDLGQQWPTPFRDLANTALPASLSSPQHAGSSTFPTTHPQAFSPVSGHQALRPSAAMSRGASAPADCSPRRPPTDSASGFDAHLSPGAPLAGAAQPSVARRRSLNQAGGGSTSGLRSFDLQRYDMPPFTVYGRQVSPSGRIASKSALFPYHPERQEESADGTNIPRPRSGHDRDDEAALPAGFVSPVGQPSRTATRPRTIRSVKSTPQLSFATSPMTGAAPPMPDLFTGSAFAAHARDDASYAGLNMFADPRSTFDDPYGRSAVPVSIGLTGPSPRKELDPSRGDLVDLDFLHGLPTPSLARSGLTSPASTEGRSMQSVSPIVAAHDQPGKTVHPHEIYFSGLPSPPPTAALAAGPHQTMSPPAGGLLGQLGSPHRLRVASSSYEGFAANPRAFALDVAGGMPLPDPSTFTIPAEPSRQLSRKRSRIAMENGEPDEADDGDVDRIVSGMRKARVVSMPSRLKPGPKPKTGRPPQPLVSVAPAAYDTGYIGQPSTSVLSNAVVGDAQSGECPGVSKDTIRSLYEAVHEAAADDCSGRTIKRYRCLVADCDRIFPRKTAIESHIQTHLEDKPFVCREPDCKAAFVRQHDLRRHERIHSGNKPFTCECGKGFARGDALMRHRQRGICCGSLVPRRA